MSRSGVESDGLCQLYSREHVSCTQAFRRRMSFAQRNRLAKAFKNLELSDACQVLAEVPRSFQALDIVVDLLLQLPQLL